MSRMLKSTAEVAEQLQRELTSAREQIASLATEREQLAGELTEARGYIVQIATALDVPQGSSNEEIRMQVKEIAEEWADLQASFDLRWKADMRAIARWRGGDPAKALTMPDHADLCVWLLAQLDGERERADKAEAMLRRVASRLDITPDSEIALLLDVRLRRYESDVNPAVAAKLRNEKLELQQQITALTQERDAQAAGAAALRKFCKRLQPLLDALNHVHLPDGTILYASELWDALSTTAGLEMLERLRKAERGRLDADLALMLSPHSYEHWRGMYQDSEKRGNKLCERITQLEAALVAIRPFVGQDQNMDSRDVELCSAAERLVDDALAAPGAHEASGPGVDAVTGTQDDAVPQGSVDAIRRYLASEPEGPKL